MSDAVQSVPSSVDTSIASDVTIWSPRPLLWTEVGESVTDDIYTFSAITYNILNECYVLGGTAYESYLNGDCEYLKHSSLRNERILKELATWDHPDIVTLQEMHRELYDTQWAPTMTARGYDGVLSTPLSKGLNNVALFVKSDVFEVLGSWCDPFDNVIERYFNPSGTASTEIHLLQHHRSSEYCGIVAKLRHRPTGRLLVVGSYHLTWEDYTAPVFKSLQIAALMKLAEEVAFEGVDTPCPLLILGDMNSQPDDMTYHMMSEDWWPSDILDGPEVSRQSNILKPFVQTNCRLPPGLKLKSCYLEALGHEPQVTSITEEHGAYESSTVDYIWRSEGRGLSLSGVMSEVSEKAARRFSALPSPLFPSDHLPLMAKLRFQSVKA